MLETPCIRRYSFCHTSLRECGVSSDNPTGADNQQGSRRPRAVRDLLTPQRLHAELLDTGANGLEAYLQGALRHGTRSTLHNTHRFCQSDPGWIALLRDALEFLGYRGWVYREGQSRNLWVVETRAGALRAGNCTIPATGLTRTTGGSMSGHDLTNGSSVW
jgi:hypothetical protein